MLHFTFPKVRRVHVLKEAFSHADASIKQFKFCDCCKAHSWMPTNKEAKTCICTDTTVFQEWCCICHYIHKTHTHTQTDTQNVMMSNDARNSFRLLLWLYPFGPHIMTSVILFCCFCVCMTSLLLSSRAIYSVLDTVFKAIMFFTRFSQANSFLFCHNSLKHAQKHG